MPTTLHKIELPSLVNSNFGTNLKNVFENIDSNFQKLSSLGLTTGASGKPSVWIPYNLNAAFCTHIINGNVSSTYLPDDVVNQIQKDYNKYQEITNNSAYIYIMECILIYNDMLKAIHTDVDGTSHEPVIISYRDDNDELKFWKQKWENDVVININYLYIENESDTYHRIYNKILANDELRCSQSVTDNDIELLKNYLYNRDTETEGPYLTFLPGTVLVAGNFDENTEKFTKLGTMAHIYIDPRFRSPYVIAGKLTDEELAQLEDAVDQSCVVYGTGYYESDIKDYELKFDYSYAFPRIHCQDGEFYLKVNDIATNIPLTGRTGKAGKDSQFAIVKLASDCGLDEETYRSISNDVDEGRRFNVGNTIPEVDTWDDKKPTLDGCPALVFPPDDFIPSSYTSVYWMSHLKWDGEELTAYCGRENLVEVTLYDHAFAGMMMGLDVYERSIATPTGNQPWYKPRGLMLPIGSRYIDANNEWRPWTPGNQSNDNAFSAHLIYSTGGTAKNKKELHISSVKDYREIGQVEDHIPSNPRKPASNNIFNDTYLFIDEPVEITPYTSSSYKTDDPLLKIPKGYQTISGYDTSGWNFVCPTSNTERFKNVWDNSCLIPGTGYTFSTNTPKGNRVIDPRIDVDTIGDLTTARNIYDSSVTYSWPGTPGEKYDVVEELNKPGGGVYGYTRKIQYGNYAVGGSGDNDDFTKYVRAAMSGGYHAFEENGANYGNLGYGLRIDNAIRAQTITARAIGSSYIYAEKLIRARNLIALEDTQGHGGSVLASHFAKKDAENGQILLANGYATIPQKPIRLLYQKGDGSTHTLEFEAKPNNGSSMSDGNVVFRNSNGNRLVTGDSMTYVGGDTFSIDKNFSNTYTGGNCTLSTGCYNSSWSSMDAQKACPSNITFPSGNALKGVYFSYKSGNVVFTKVILAANSERGSASSMDTFGLPLDFSKDGSETEVPRFDNIPLIDGLNDSITPLFNITQFWGAQAGIHADSDGTWKADKIGKVKGAGVSCTITNDGKILLSGAQVRALFSTNNINNNKKYIEFNFIYPTALVSPQQTPAHYVYTGELDVETGKPVNTDMTDTSVWHLVDEYEGSTGDITYEIVVKQNPEADLDTDAKPTEFNTESEEWTFEPYVEPDPDPIVLNYIYTGAMRHGIPAILDMTDSTVWFKADEFEGATSDIAARITATHEGSRGRTRIPEPRTYGKNSDGWTFEITLEPHTHYWKCEGDDLPEDGTEITGRLPQTISLDPAISITAYNIDSIPSEWYEDTKIWNLISVGTTTKDLTNYNVYYNTENAEAGITAESWSSSPVKPESNITFQWLGGHGYDIVSYLKQTQLAWSHNGYWQGPLFDIFKPANFSNGKTYTYEGFRGKVEVSQYRESLLATTWYGDMTIECWNSDLSARIYDHYTISYDAVQTSMSGRLDVNDKVISMRGSMKGEMHSDQGEITPGGGQIKPNTPSDGDNSGSGTTPIDPSIGGGTVRP